MNAIMKRKRNKVGLGLSGPLDDSVISNWNSEMGLGVFGRIMTWN